MATKSLYNLIYKIKYINSKLYNGATAHAFYGNKTWNDTFKIFMKVGWIPYHLQTAIRIEFAFGRINASPSDTVYKAVSTSQYVINDESPNNVRTAGGECQEWSTAS